jgi:hypothetical protein
MMRQSQRIRRERRQQIGAEPEVGEDAVDREDVADLGVDVEEEAEEDFDQFADRNTLDLGTMPSTIFVQP